MPHSDRSLEIIYEYYEAIHDADKIQTQILGKNQEVRTFGNQVLMSNASHNVDELRLAEANQFAALITGLGLDLKDDVDARSKNKKRETALHGAVKLNRLDILITLLDHSASPAIEDANGNNVIMLAAELGRKEMLQEFCKMLKVEAKQKEASKSDEIKIETPAGKAQEQKMEAERAKAAEIQGKKKHSPKRVALTDEELKKKNKDGKTAICLLEEVLNSGGTQAKDEPVERKQAQKKKELTAAFKDMVNNLSLQYAALKKNEQVAEVMSSGDAGETLNRYWQSCHLYQNVFTPFQNAFLETRNEVKLKNPEEKASHPELNAFVNTIKDKPAHVILPYDRATIAGVLALLNQYSCFSFFHPMRRYRQDASNLVEPYLMASGPGKKEMATVKDVLEFYQRIVEELASVQDKDQTSEDKNNPYNSGYCRRLTYCKNQLENTEIVKNYLCGDKRFNLKLYEDYLINNRHKLQLPARPIND